MRIQSTHSHADRGLDPYFSPPEAIHSLISIEGDWIPEKVWEPAAGTGAIVKPLRQAGYKVVASDIADYGLKGCRRLDFLTASIPAGVDGIITNPPYRLALKFAQRSILNLAMPYTALLLRTNFLESVGRLPFFLETPPTRVWISSRRLPMMHRLGWTGPKAPSNTCFAWFIWEYDSLGKTPELFWFDWKDHMPVLESPNA